MALPAGRLQFFVLEATDYLDRLAVIADRSSPPEGDDLVRLTRALRGAALMAGLESFAQAGGALEHTAKAHRDHPAGWTIERGTLVAAAIRELKRLTARAAEWTDADDLAARDLARHVATSVGGAPVPTREPAPAEDDHLKPSVREFIGREGAVIAGTLEHAAQSLELGQPGQAADLVLAKLQPLRGLASLPRLSPLPEFLDAIELTIRQVQDASAPPGGPLALRRAAAAVSRLAREIADRGEANPDTPEIAIGAVSLLESFGSEFDVVAIESLFRAGDQAPIVVRGDAHLTDTAPPDPTLELVSLADRLRQAADQLTLPASSAGRTLNLYGLVVQLRPLGQRARDERPHLAGLLSAVAGAIGSGRALKAPRDFAAALRDAADLIGRAAEARNAIFLADELAPIVHAIARLQTAAPIPVDDESDAVPIESLAPDPVTTVEPEPVPIASLAPDAPALPTSTIFERSFSTYHQLLHPPVTAPADTDVVPIGDLLYRGRRALERADTVRLELSQALKLSNAYLDIEPLVSELIDLVPLALTE